MAKRDLPSPDVLRQLLRYEPETGKLFWRERGVEWFSGKTARCEYWNRRYAGSEAFTSVSFHGYRQGTIFGSGGMKAHRVAWAMTFDVWPECDVDHVNGVRTDNRLCNLREASRSENIQNQKMHSDNSSGRKGVYWHKRAGKWNARIMVNGAEHHLGLFENIDDASAAYDEAARMLHGDFARTNEVILAD